MKRGSSFPLQSFQTLLEGGFKIAIFALTERGKALGERIRAHLDAELYLPQAIAGKGTVPFKDLRETVSTTFRRYKGLVFIMATGIVVRIVAPLLKGKERDPAVVVMDEDGRFAISLLSGHLGGANLLANRIGELTGAQPVITTATDVNGLPSIEAIASAIGCRIEEVGRIKLVNSAILRGKRIAFIGEDGVRLGVIREILKCFGLERRWGVFGLDERPKGWLPVIITERMIPDLPVEAFILRPRSIAIGVGCDRGVGWEEVERAYRMVLKRWGISPLSVARLATIDIKRDEEGLLHFAERHGLRIDFYSKEELAGFPLPSGVSGVVMERVGVGGVCEPAAMRSAGVREILFKKVRAGRVTLAAARIPFKRGGQNG